jgi:hypothetical protein
MLIQFASESMSLQQFAAETATIAVGSSRHVMHVVDMTIPHVFAWICAEVMMFFAWIRAKF